MSKHIYSYLALGDSYTIGESLPLHESFPYQVVQLLRRQGLSFHAPEIVAKTGWTSNELAEHILHTSLNDTYDFVTLLVGVNNQYRGLSIEDFTTDFQFLLRKAIHFAGDLAARVTVLSIPDWGVTTYAEKRDGKKIGAEIDAFNKVCAAASREMKTNYIDITQETRKAASDKTLLAADGLHYTAKEHALWAAKVAGIMAGQAHK